VTRPFRVAPLAQHDRAFFECGDAVLDRYFRTQVTQDVKRRIANCFVAIDVVTDRVAGFYTLSAASIALAELPPEVAKRLPRYPSIPAVRIGRLANDQRFRGRGLGGALLADAARRTVEAAAAAYAILVDAKSEAAVSFYEHYGFLRFASAPMSLFLPVETARKAMLGT
jgi:GNAT superfamily N-acetyltransferase